MEPYQRAGENLKERNALPGKLAKGAASLAGNAAVGVAGGAIASRVLPFLSEHIPMSLAIKGLTKVNPRLGQFVSKAMDEGYDFDEVKDFIGEKMQPQEEVAKQEIEKKPSSQPNLIGQASPELQSFIEQQIQAGKAPDHAAASAMPRAEFADIIRKIEKQEKKKFTALVRELYEGKAVQQPESQAALQGQPQQSQQGLDPGVAQILQQGQALLQKFKGGM